MKHVTQWHAMASDLTVLDPNSPSSISKSQRILPKLVQPHQVIKGDTSPDHYYLRQHQYTCSSAPFESPVQRVGAQQYRHKINNQKIMRVKELKALPSDLSVSLRKYE